MPDGLGGRGENHAARMRFIVIGRSSAIALPFELGKSFTS
jgi:hypothetical protein